MPKRAINQNWSLHRGKTILNFRVIHIAYVGIHRIQEIIPQRIDNIPPGTRISINGDEHEPTKK